MAKPSAATSAAELEHMFGALSNARVSPTGVREIFRVSVDFQRFKLNVAEQDTVARIAQRGQSFERVAAKDVRTLAAISRMAEFRGEDRESLR